MQTTINLRALLTVVALLTGASYSAAHAQGAKRGKAAPEVYTGIIVKYKSAKFAPAGATSATAMQAVEDRARVKIAASRKGAMDLEVYRFAKATPAAEARAAAARVALDPNVEYAVPDQIMRALDITPNDTEFAAKQWDLQGPPAVAGGTNLPPAWQRTTGSSSIVVAVVDTGVRTGHPDLAGRLVAGYDFISSDAYASDGFPANWNAADGNGRDADASDPGDYVDDTLLAQLPPNHGLTPSPSSWHGTHVAGTIGAASNNKIGIAGIDWNARILPVRVLGRAGGTTSDIVDGIAWAAGLSVPNVPNNPTPARVINMSLGGSGSCSAAFQDVINRVRAAGAIVVVAAGNDGALSVSQPANCNGVIAVTAHARDGDNASYANVGSQVAISAAGGGCGTNSVLDLDNAQDIWNNTCSDCHNNTGGIDGIRQQIDARAPAGLTFTKARAALEAALTGTDLGGQATGMQGISGMLTARNRNDLAGLISNQTCAIERSGVLSTLNLGTTMPDADGYGEYIGTSMAVPHVSGVISLMLSLSPHLSTDEVKSVLQTTARPHPAGTYCVMVPGNCGSGLLDADAALKHVADNRPTVTVALQSGPGTGVRPSAPFTLVGTVNTVGSRAVAAGAMKWRQTSGPTVTLPSTTGSSITITAPATGSLGFEFTAEDSAGYSATATVALVVNSPPTLAQPAAVTVPVGQPVSGVLVGSDPDRDAITYVLTAGPPGLTVNAGTGAWSWTPSSGGSFTVTVLAKDAYSNGTPVSYTITVEDKDGGGGALPAWIAAALLLSLRLRKRRQ